MTDSRSRRSLLGAAAAISALGFLIAAVSGQGLAAVFSMAALLPTLVVLAAELRPPSPTQRLLLEKAAGQAEAGRKLVIYERETGLFAHWYLALRCEEECQRAARYERSLTLLLVEPSGDSEAWEVHERLANWLRHQLRIADLPGYLGNARYAVLMPETTAEGAQHLVARLLDDVEGTEAGLSSFPADGQTFDELCAAARERLGDLRQAA